ncbi:hypothetical protein BM1_00486 [Bipolaris maydis]|nr:hypothetical protein BM1_00486 [Bipolaris maydis]
MQSYPISTGIWTPDDARDEQGAVESWENPTMAIFVLYPWHEKLEEEFVQLKKEHATLLEEMHQNHRSELRGIREQLELANERRKTGRFW